MGEIQESRGAGFWSWINRNMSCLQFSAIDFSRRFLYILTYVICRGEARIVTTTFSGRSFKQLQIRFVIAFEGDHVHENDTYRSSCSSPFVNDCSTIRLGEKAATFRI